MKKLFLIFSLIFLYISCTLQPDNTTCTGNLVVKNESKTANKVIVSVLVKEYPSNGYKLVWDGNLPKDFTEIIKLNPGKYSCKIIVKDITKELDNESQFETGYKIYHEISAGDYVDLIFDGNGIYFN